MRILHDLMDLEGISTTFLRITDNRKVRKISKSYPVILTGILFLFKLSLLDFAVASDLGQDQENGPFSILNSCKTKYEKENEGFASSMFSSQRGIFEEVIKAGIDCNQGAITEIEAGELDNLIKSVGEIDQFLREMNLLSETTSEAFDSTIEGLISQHALYRDDEILTNKERQRSFLLDLLNSKPELKKDRAKLNNAFKKALQTARKKGIKKINQVNVASAYASFGKSINQICNDFRSKTLSSGAKVSKQTARGKRVYTDNGIYNQVMHESKQKLQKALFEFSTENKEIAPLLYTDSFRDQFSLNDEMVTDCMNGKQIEPIDVSEVGQATDGPAAKAILDIEELLNQDMNQNIENLEVLRSRDKEDIKDKIQDVLKYKPYLAGRFLKHQNTSEQVEYAKYICKETLAIYDNDEIWNVGYFVGGLAVGAIAGILVPGVGLGVAATFLAGAATAGTEIAIEYKDGEAILSGAQVGAINNKIDHNSFLDREQKKKDKDSQALITAGGAALGGVAGKIGKGLKTVGNSNKGSSLAKVKATLDTANIPGPLAEVPKRRLASITDEAISNSKLDDIQRASLIKKDYPSLNSNQRDIILEAHNNPKLRCPIGQCHSDQIRAKRDIMLAAGIDEDTVSDIISRGIAGDPPTTKGLIYSNIASQPKSDPADFSLFKLRNLKLDNSNPNEEWLASIQKTISNSDNIKPIKIKVEMTNPDGSKTIKELDGSIHGASADGKQLQFMPGGADSGAPMQYIDLDNNKIKVLSVHEFKKTYTHDADAVSGTQFLPQVEVPIYTKDAAEALKGVSKGTHVEEVKLKYTTEYTDGYGSDYHTAEGVLKKDSKSGEMFILKKDGNKIPINEKLGNVEVYSVYKSERFTFSEAGSRYSQMGQISEKFKSGNPIKLKLNGTSKKASEGEYLGLVEQRARDGGNELTVIIRRADGELEYIPAGEIEEMSSSAAEKMIYETPKSQKIKLKDINDDE